MIHVAHQFVSPERLRLLFAYDASDGSLYWKRRPVEDFASARAWKAWTANFCGKRAGRSGGDYVTIRAGRSFLRAHRVVWALVHGAWPDGDIDHINGDGRDNRIANLRVVTAAGNARNRRLYYTNKSGVPGVSSFERGWRVHVGNTYLGYFSDFAQAVAVRRAAEREDNFHPNHGRAA